jgi:hypothetical protein
LQGISPSLHEYRPSALHHSCTDLKTSPETQVPKSLSSSESMVELYPPLNLMVEIHLHLTHRFRLDKGGPTLNSHQSHDATWNYPGMPHHHGVCGPIQSELDTTTRELFDTSTVFNTPPISSNLPPESRSSKVLELLATYSSLRPSRIFKLPLVPYISSPLEVRLHRSTYVSFH